MAGLPRLSEIDRRRLELRLEKLREKHGLADDNPLRHLRKHLQWPYSAERRALAREQRIVNSDELCVYEGLITHTYDQITGTPIFPTRVPRPPDSERARTSDKAERKQRKKPIDTSWQRYVQLYRDLYRNLPESKDEFDKFLSKFDPLAALLDDPDTIDRIGLKETAEYFIGSFKAYAEAYSSKPYKNFIALLGKIELLAIEKCSVLWPDRGDWVERLVVPAASHQLENAKLVWSDKARDAELARLDDRQAAKKTKPRPAADTVHRYPAKEPRARHPAYAEEWKRIREELGLTQEKFAEVVHQGERTIQRAEQGKSLSLTTFSDVAKHLRLKKKLKTKAQHLMAD